MPRARNESTQSEQEYIIAQQTRSKVNLEETSIETFDAMMLVDDAPYNLQTDWSIDDTAWLQFLNNHNSDKPSEYEEDEDTDPNYVAADIVPVDKEELRQPKVPKKELDDILMVHGGAEFLDAIFNGSWDGNSSNMIGASNDVLNDAATDLATPVKDEPHVNASSVDTNNIVSMSSESNLHFDQRIAPPSMPIPYTPCIGSTDVNYHQGQYFYNPSNNFDVNTTIAATSFGNSHTYSLAANASNSERMEMPTTLGVDNVPSTPAHQFILVLPSESIATSVTNTITTTSTTQINLPLNTLNRQLMAGQNSCKVIAKRTRFKKNRFIELENLDPQNTDVRKVRPPAMHCNLYLNRFVFFQTFNPATRGFTDEQRTILDQQLRMHVQLSAQNCMQTYGHPQHYSHAYKFKRFLVILTFSIRPHSLHVFVNQLQMDLQEMATGQRIVNLASALTTIAEWENDLAIDCDENTEFIQHIRNEMEKLRTNPRYEMRFHEIWLRKVCHSTAFMYASLLPTIPFRFDTKKISEYLPSEE